MALQEWISDNFYKSPVQLSHYKPLAVANEEWSNYLVAEEVKANAVAKQVMMDSVVTYTNQPPYLWDAGLPDLPESERHRQALRLLQEAYARLKVPGVWTKGHDRITYPDVPGGVRFCARGVLIWLAQRMGYSGGLRDAMHALAAHAPLQPREACAPHNTIAHNNDLHTTQLHDVLSWFDRTVAHLERKTPIQVGRA